MSDVRVTREVSQLEQSLSRALRDESSASRLCHARTRVAFVDPHGDAVTLDLTGQAPGLHPGDRDADIRIQFTSRQLQDFMSGRLPVTMALLRGKLDVQGPVRRYAEVDPILRGLLHPQGLTKDIAHYDGDFNAPAVDLLAIETRDLHKSFGRREVLRGVDLQVPEGVISVVLGPSGTGKSVLLSHIMGLMKPDQGAVLVRSRPLSEMSTDEMLDLRLEIGVMYQDGALFSTMNIFDNVAFPLRQHTDLTDAEVRQVVTDQLTQVGLGDAVSRMPGELSGGMRKRAGLARALVRDPSVLVCDEPDSGLDPVRTSLLGELLVEQHARIGGTIIVITHNMLLARTVADHISVLYDGRILTSGFAHEIFNSDDAFVRQFVNGETAGPLGMD